MRPVPPNRLQPVLLSIALALPWLVVSGCQPKSENSVVIYSAADREYAQPILGAFARRNEGIEVKPVFDIEASKTVGLVTRIESESSRTRCDVFWNNEIMHTLRLEKAGLLAPIRWDIPADWPKAMRSPDRTWVGIAARARILIVNRELLPADGPRPDSVEDLIDPKWKDQCGIALPLFGTTATHFAVLDTQLGKESAASFFSSVKANARVLAGNKQVAQAVSSGQLAFGLTDTDDALVEIDAGLPVDIIFPDQGASQAGALRIPNTVAVLKGCPHPVVAASLANFLVGEDTEGRLAMGPSGQFPVRPGHPQKSRAAKELEGEDAVQPRWMEVDFNAAAERWPTLAEELDELFR